MDWCNDPCHKKSEAHGYGKYALRKGNWSLLGIRRFQQQMLTPRIEPVCYSLSESAQGLRIESMVSMTRCQCYLIGDVITGITAWKSSKSDSTWPKREWRKHIKTLTTCTLWTNQCLLAHVDRRGNMGPHSNGREAFKCDSQWYTLVLSRTAGEDAHWDPHSQQLV